MQRGSYTSTAASMPYGGVSYTFPITTINPSKSLAFFEATSVGNDKLQYVTWILSTLNQNNIQVTAYTETAGGSFKVTINWQVVEFY